VKLNTRTPEDMSATRLGGLETRRAGDGEKGRRRILSTWLIESCIEE